MRQHVDPTPGNVLLGRARRLVAALGGRFSTELGIDVDRGPDEVERWALAATLFGNRISARIALRTYRVLERAGIRTLADAGGHTWDELVALLDEGGYARYDYRTATRLLRLAGVLRERLGGRVGAVAASCTDPIELETALDELPGWGPVTVRSFLRELRGVWPAAAPALDERAAEAAGHLGLSSDPASLRELAVDAGLDPRDLETGLVRLAMAHDLARCPGGEKCAIAGELGGNPDARSE